MAKVCEELALVERFRRGDDSAFDRIVAQYSADVAALANRLLGWPGDVDDVVQEVRQSVEIYRDVRWICAPCHNLQPVTPTENVVAMYQTIHELG